MDDRGNVKVGNSMLNSSSLRNCNLADVKYTENRRVRSTFEPQDLKVIYIHKYTVPPLCTLPFSQLTANGSKPPCLRVGL